MKLAIVEPRPDGHHMAHVRCIAREALRRRWDLHLVTTRTALGHEGFLAVLRECGDGFTVSTIPEVAHPGERAGTVELLRYQWRHFRAFDRACRSLAGVEKPDAIYLVNLDYCDKVLALLGSPFGAIPFGGMLMSARFHHRRMGVLTPRSRWDPWCEALFARLLRVPSLCALATIDESLREYAEARRFHGWRKVRFMRDIGGLSGGMSRDQARESLRLPENRILILAYGVLAARKGIAPLLSAVAHSNCPERVTVMLAGQVEEDAVPEVTGPAAQALRARGRLLEKPGFLSDEQECQAFRAADIVWLGYRGFYGMSGVLVQAGMAGLPVIACREGLIGWLAKRHGLGEVVEVTELLQVVGSISRLAGDRALRERYGANGSRMAAGHSPEQFGSAICDAIAGGLE